ncbi:MAG TPA: serine/threonine-protein kinase [Gemmatimonadales bacterium]|nr:serine/threonine-protein kinase [Gemmatimonadales bacterium]
MATAARHCPSCHTSLADDAQFCHRCLIATPSEPGVDPRLTPTSAVEVGRVRRVLAEQYQIERVVGEGGMATVFRAEDLKHRRKVAVKVMRPELAATLGGDRFLREVEIAAQLNHPHIVSMHDSGDNDGVLYYVMPFVEGESLTQRLAREGPLPVGDALRIARQVSDALAHAHKRGIIHRDIKPGNIMLSEGHALVADFGIARALRSGATAITTAGLAIGTPHYMSPEQATGSREVDERTDVYAVGAVLYEMLTGGPPFTGRSGQAIISRSVTEPHRPLAASRPGLPPSLEPLVSKALAKSAADRVASAEELSNQIAKVQTELARASVPMAHVTADELRRWGMLGGALVLSLVLLSFIAGRWGLPPWLLLLAAVGLGLAVWVLKKK